MALKELNEELYDLGHHHGLAMLVASRLCRTLATIEDKAMHELPSLKKMLVAQTTMHVLCAGAVVAVYARGSGGGRRDLRVRHGAESRRGDAGGGGGEGITYCN